MYVRKEPTLSTPKRSNWPLLRRGWMFQELSLSPRTIHFLRGKVILLSKECFNAKYAWQMLEESTEKPPLPLGQVQESRDNLGGFLETQTRVIALV
jgi:hypothetical protein